MLNRAASRLLRALAVISSTLLLMAQPPPPPADPKAIDRSIGEIRVRLQRNPPATAQQKELAAFVQRYLDAAARALHAGRRYQAQRLADAADACRRAIEHLQHLETANLAPPPPKPPGEEDDRLRQVYFRLRLSDFFLQQMPPPAPRRLLDLARGFYELAVQAQQAGKRAVADEYAAAADDLTHALESLAQAALP